MLRLSVSPRCLTTTRDARVRLSSDRLPVGMVTWNVGWIWSFFPAPRGDVGGLAKSNVLGAVYMEEEDPRRPNNFSFALHADISAEVFTKWRRKRRTTVGL